MKKVQVILSKEQVRSAFRIVNAVLAGSDTLFRPREIEILELMYGVKRVGEPKTLREISHHYDVTEARIKQIESKMNEKLGTIVEAWCYLSER